MKEPSEKQGKIDKVDDFLNKYGDGIFATAGFIVQAGIVFAAASFIWSMVYLLHKGDETRATKSRNMNTFNMVAQEQYPDILPEVWDGRQRSITSDIRSEERFLQWLVFDGFANDGNRAIEAADDANIYMIPHTNSDKPSHLTVDDNFGCIQLPYNANDRVLVEQAGDLLREFERRTREEYQAYGTYTFEESENGSSIVFEARDSNNPDTQASQVCPVVTNENYSEELAQWKAEEPSRFRPR